jgi:hypothetical protein
MIQHSRRDLYELDEFMGIENGRSIDCGYMVLT